MALGHEAEDFPLPFGELVKGTPLPASVEELADDGWVDDALACAHPLQGLGEDG
jgi:hypothetical protein